MSLVDEWWLTYSTALSPSINFFLLMTDTIAMQNRPHHLSLFNPSPLTTSLLFHLGTQRGYAHAKGKKEIKEKKKTYIDLGGTCLFLDKREVWKNPHVGLSDKPHFFSTNPNERLRRMLALLNWSSTCPCMAPLIVYNTHTPSFLFSPLHAIYYTRTLFPLSSFFFFLMIHFLTQKGKK